MQIFIILVGCQPGWFAVGFAGQHLAFEGTSHFNSIICFFVVGVPFLAQPGGRLQSIYTSMDQTNSRSTFNLIPTMRDTRKATAPTMTRTMMTTRSASYSNSKLGIIQNDLPQSTAATTTTTATTATNLKKRKEEEEVVQEQVQEQEREQPQPHSQPAAATAGIAHNSTNTSNSTNTKSSNDIATRSTARSGGSHSKTSCSRRCMAFARKVVKQVQPGTTEYCANMFTRQKVLCTPAIFVFAKSQGSVET